MSVPKYKRDIAPAEFVRTAAELEALTGKMCARLPKRWAFVRTRYITDCANNILDNVVRANSIWVTTEADAEQRRWHLMEAYSACYTLLRKIDIIAIDRPIKMVENHLPDGTVEKVEKPCISDGLIKNWVIVATREIKLIKGVIRYDRARFSKKRKPLKVRRNRKSTIKSRKLSRRVVLGFEDFE